MRLSNAQKQGIIRLTRQHFGDRAQLYLFGSRTDDSLKGGDIDLYLESDHEIEFDAKLAYLSALEKEVTSRKVDLVIKTPGSQPRPIFETAKASGIPLC